jgi:anti-sigma B factor antagonist
MSNVNEPFTVRTFADDGSVLLVVSGELDIATAPRLERAVSDVLDGRLQVLTVDLAGVSFLDVRGQRTLVEASAAVAGLGSRFELRGVKDSLRRAIHLVGFEELQRAAEVESI